MKKYCYNIFITKSRGRMRMIKKIKAKSPSYFKDFKCIGGECEDSCCIGWDIDVDQKTYEDYMNCENIDFNELFRNNMHINDEISNENVDHAKINLREDKKCPFLDTCNYCRIHSELGEKHLSNTCSHFPRVLNKVDEEYEISLDIACPEVARIVLSDKNSVSFEENDLELNKYIVAGEIDTNDEEYEEYPIKHFKKIRDYCINIIQSKEFDLCSRLYILGDFLLRFEEGCYSDSSSVCEFIENYDLKEAEDNYQRNDLNYMMQISFFDNIINSLEIYYETDSELFRKYTKQALDGFNIESNEQLEEESDRYIDAFADYSRDYIEENNYIFENYLVNFIYNNLFPYSESDSMFEGYIMLLVRYSLIRFYLVGRYLCNKNESVNDIINFMQVFSKAVEHDKNYMEEILEYILENEFDNMEFAEMLI